MTRYFISLEYDGTSYNGWQIQPNATSVQETIERGISTILRRDIRVVGAGRTDTGVHAATMMAHFDFEGDIPDLAKLTDNLNRFLPSDIAIHRMVEVRPDAHARFDAMARTYHYKVHFGKSAFINRYSVKLHGQYDFEKMNKAARTLLNYSDFTSFSKLHTDVKTNNCKVSHAEWMQCGKEWVFVITADRFLRNMVRAIVGTLLEVGRGKVSVEQFCKIIERMDRRLAGSSAPAKGLSLVDIKYPEEIFNVSFHERYQGNRTN